MVLRMAHRGRGRTSRCRSQESTTDMSDAQLSNTVGLADERFVPGTHRGELMEAEHYARYFWASALVAGRRVLDAGCGVGYGSRLLHGAGAAEVVGLDVSADAIQAA